MTLLPSAATVLKKLHLRATKSVKVFIYSSFSLFEGRKGMFSYKIHKVQNIYGLVVPVVFTVQPKVYLHLPWFKYFMYK